MPEPADDATDPRGRTVAIVDDHPVVRRGLAELLETELGLRVVLSGCQLSAVLEISPPPDLVLLDLDLGGRMASTDDVARILALGPRVLVVSALASSASVRAMVRVGVSGVVSKAEPPEVVVEAVSSVLREGTWTGPETAAAIAADPSRPSLSAQEERILVLYASGMKAETVAHRMELAPGTVKTYVKRIRAKYAEAGRPVPNKTDLYREARRDGYLLDEPGSLALP